MSGASKARRGNAATAPVPAPPPGAAIGDADMAEVRDAALDKAKSGDMHATTVVERMWRRQRRTVRLDLPPVNDAAGLAAAQAAVIAAAACGHITPREGIAWAALLDYRRRALDAVEYEASLREIEKNNAERTKREAEKKP